MQYTILSFNQKKGVYIEIYVKYIFFASKLNPVEHSPTIVVIEDDEDMLGYVTSILEDYYNIITAPTADQGRSFIESGTGDLVICDIVMPGTDGYTFLDEIRHEGKFIPFLFLTGKTEKSSLLRALDLGADGYITKPFDSEELLARIKNLLQNYSARIHSSPPKAAGEGYVSSTFQQTWLQSLEQHILARINQMEIKIPEIAGNLNLSERTFRNRVKEYTGLSPNEFIMNTRLELARKFIKERRYQTVLEVAFAVGISSGSYFSNLFKSKYGILPSDFQHQCS